MLYTHTALLGPTCLHTNYHQQPSKAERNFGGLQLSAHTRQSNRDSPTDTLTYRPSPSHPLIFSFTLTSPLFLTHSHPTRAVPLHLKKSPLPPQLQEIPNDLHHQCACCISCQEPACARTHTTNTHTKHINEQRATHKPYVQTNKKGDRRSDRQTHI